MRILAIGAHLDDVEVGCGATLAKAVDRGHEVRVLVLSPSDYVDYRGAEKRDRATAVAEGQVGAAVLGVAHLTVLDFPAKDISHHSNVVEAIEPHLDAFGPELILTHFAFDTHQAHVGTALSTISAARRHAGILMYEPTPPSGRSYVAFRPQVYVDVGHWLDRKLDALRAHRSQYEKYGDAWIEAIEGRARYRGFENGCRAAEAFEVVRMGLTL